MHRPRILLGAAVLLWLISSLIPGPGAYDAARAQEQRCWELVSVQGDFKRLIEGGFDPLSEAAVADIPHHPYNQRRGAVGDLPPILWSQECIHS